MYPPVDEKEEEEYDIKNVPAIDDVKKKKFN
jgi:hypothetical protein